MGLAPLKYKEGSGIGSLDMRSASETADFQSNLLQGSEDTDVHSVKHAKLSQGNKAPSRNIKIQFKENEGIRQEDTDVEGDDTGVKDMFR